MSEIEARYNKDKQDIHHACSTQRPCAVIYLWLRLQRPKLSALEENIAICGNGLGKSLYLLKALGKCMQLTQMRNEERAEEP